MPNRRIIVYAGTSADGFIARPDGDIEWLTSRPKPEGFYDIGKFTTSIDAKILGRKTYEKGLALGAKFDGTTRINVNPVLIGEGIALIAPRPRHVPLRLLSSRQFIDGVVQLHYEVQPRAPLPPSQAAR